MTAYYFVAAPLMSLYLVIYIKAYDHEEKQRIQCLGYSHSHKQEMMYFQSEIHSREICIDVSG